MVLTPILKHISTLILDAPHSRFAAHSHSDTACSSLPICSTFPLSYCMILTPVLQHIPNLVVDIKTMGNRVYVSDVQESIHYLRYRATENQLVIFSDDTYQR